MLAAIQTAITLFMWGMMLAMKFKKKSSSKLLSPFECGYSVFTSNFPLSIQFTMIMFMFLLFDIELSILISASTDLENMSKTWISTMMTFLLFMVISVAYEMMKKSYKWN